MTYTEAVEMIERLGFVKHSIEDVSTRYIIPGAADWCLKVDTETIWLYDTPQICTMMEPDGTKDITLNFFGKKWLYLIGIESDELREMLQEIKVRFDIQMKEYKHRVKEERIKAIREL